MLLLSSSWSMKTWSRMKLRSSDCRDASDVYTRGSRASLPPEMIWWLKISSRSQRMVKVWGRTYSQVQAVCSMITRCDLWYRPALWRRCWHWLGNVGTLDKTPSSASLESPCPPTEIKCIVDIQQTTANKGKGWMHTNHMNGSYLFRSALRDLG